MTRICTACARDLPLDKEHFDYTGEGRRWFTKKCKLCRKSRADERRTSEAGRAALKVYNRDYYARRGQKITRSRRTPLLWEEAL